MFAMKGTFLSISNIDKNYRNVSFLIFGYSYKMLLEI
jgi:hypothetical protein